MKIISAVDLRNDLERIIKLLCNGERMELTYRGKTVGRLLPTPEIERAVAQGALERMAKRHADDPAYGAKVEKYIQEVYEDRRSYGSREVPE